MDIDDFLRKVEIAIDNVEPNSLRSDLDFQKNLEAWDSLAALSLVAMIDAEYQVVLTGQDLISCRTFGELFERVLDKREQKKIAAE
jgi:acyl carrier protein